MDERIIELETRLAFQDHTIQTLNDTVIEQDRRIAQLAHELEVLRQRLQAVATSNIASPTEETPPPHY